MGTYDKFEVAHVAFVWSRGRSGLSPGGFKEALIEAMIRADSRNIEKLRRGFPETVAALELIQKHGEIKALEIVNW